MPADLVPDFILGLGFGDVAAVIAWVVGAGRDELAKFKGLAGRLTKNQGADHKGVAGGDRGRAVSKLRMRCDPRRASIVPSIFCAKSRDR